jgi:hypothetical protein
MDVLVAFFLDIQKIRFEGSILGGYHKKIYLRTFHMAACCAQFRPNFILFLLKFMDKSALSHQILTCKENLLTDENLIETAILLEKQNLIFCLKENVGIRVKLNLNGIDEWMKNELCGLHADWKSIQPGVYGIAAAQKEPDQLVKNGQSIFLFHYQSLWIEPFEFSPPCQPQDTVVSFADIFCQKKPLANVVLHIANQGKISFYPEFKETGIFLNKIKIVRSNSVIQKNLLGILAEHQLQTQQHGAVPFLSFETLAEQLYEKCDIYVENMKRQIYKPLHDLQMKVAKKNSLIELQELVEIKKGMCRLHPHIFCIMS